MYTSLKHKTFMKTIAQIFLLLLLALFTTIGTALLIGTAHAADVTAGGGSHYLMQWSTRTAVWLNLGGYGSKDSCERAADALNQRSPVREFFVCTKINY